MNEKAKEALARWREENKGKPRERSERPSARKAINAKCKECIYDDCDEGTWRQQVDRCDSKDCALWLLRPRSTVAA